MITALTGAAVLLAVLVARAAALPTARRLVAVWVWLYTSGIPDGARDRRRAEMQSHIWEQIVESRNLGHTPDLIAIQIILQLIIGAPEDLSWRWGVRRASARNPDAIERLRKRQPRQWLETFAGVYSANFPLVFAYVYAMIPEKEKALEVTTDVFGRFFSERQNESLQWRISLFSLARRKVREAFQNGEVRTWGFGVGMPISPGNCDRGEDMALATRLELLAMAVLRLPLGLRDLLALKFDAELTNQEIAAVCGDSEGNIRVRLFRTLRALRQELGQARSHRRLWEDDDGESEALLPA